MKQEKNRKSCYPGRLKIERYDRKIQKNIAYNRYEKSSFALQRQYERAFFACSKYTKETIIHDPYGVRTVTVQGSHTAFLLLFIARIHLLCC